MYREEISCLLPLVDEFLVFLEAVLPKKIHQIALGCFAAAKKISGKKKFDVLLVCQRK